MEKRHILVVALLVSAFLIAAAGAQAQTVWTYQARIPFDFIVGAKTYDAGQFVIEVERPNYLADILAIKNAEGKRLARTALTRNGHRSLNDKTKLIFSVFEDAYVLKEIVAPNFGFTAPKPDTATWVLITGNEQRPKKTVTIVLD